MYSRKRTHSYKRKTWKVIFFKIGNGKKQQELVKEGQEILRKYGIDPIAGKEVLCWAPNKVVGQHDYEALEMVVDEFKKIDISTNKSFNQKHDEICDWLETMGQLSAQRNK